jgi:polysaccharide pyruvyl transferase WcaK-like protein
MGPSWRKRRRGLFSQYDAIVSAPGPFLAHYDARSSSALEDVAVASELGIPFILASHSIGPLREEGLARLRRVSLCVARESTSFDYLKAHGIPAVSSADLAFLYPYEDVAASSRDMANDDPYRVLFLRSNNIRLDDIYRAGTRLRVGAWEISLTAAERLVVATSDEHRDASFVSKLSKHLKATPVACNTVTQLVALIRSSTGIVSDRYHPAICAAALGKPVMVLPNREPHKMTGLEALLRQNDLGELKRLATAGLDAVRCELSRVQSERTP